MKSFMPFMAFGSLLLVMSLQTIGGRLLAQEDSVADLDELARQVAAGRQNLKTWVGVASITQSRKVSDPKIQKTPAPIAHDEPTPRGARSEDEPPQATVLKGPFIRTTRASVEFKMDCSTGRCWSHWQSDPAIQLKSTDAEESYEGFDHRPLDTISILTEEDYWSYDLKSKVIALNDPTGAGAQLAAQSSQLRKYAVKRPAEQALTLIDRAQVFVPMKLYELRGSMPEDLLKCQAELVKRGDTERTSIRKHPEDRSVTICRVTYLGNEAQPVRTVIETHYRHVENAVALLESAEGRSDSDSGPLTFKHSLEWQKHGDVYVPNHVRREEFDARDGSLTFSRDVTITRSDVNQPLDPAIFSEEGLELAEGDFLQSLPSKDVQVQIQGGLQPVSELLKKAKRPNAGASLNTMWVLKVNLLIISVFAMFYALRRWKQDSNVGRQG